MTAPTEDLIARLEAAEAGSRELDHELHQLFPPQSLDDALASHRVTQSLDAALALAERLNLSGPLVIHRNGPAEWGVTYVDDDTVYAPTPALALCIAVLRARSALTGSAQG